MKVLALRGFLFHALATMLPLTAAAQAEPASPDSAEQSKTVHRIEVSVKPSAILHTNDYLNGNNPEGRTMNHAVSYHLKYAFSAPEGSKEASLYPGAYQGAGVSWHEFNHQLGNPVSVYLFQGARIAKLAPRLSLNYEWNLGLALGWNPYDMEQNPSNISIGSKVTAYINVDLYLRWMISRRWDLNIGGTLSHFSNGNTSMPNYGLNIAGGMISLAYYVNRTDKDNPPARRYASEFERRLTFDLLLYGAWRQKATTDGFAIYPIPRKDAVMGFNFSPMLNLNPWLNLGVSLDGVYDRSANIFPNNDATTGNMASSASTAENEGVRYSRPKASRQMALGLSLRAEFVMPYFTINLGAGANFLNATGDFKGVYEVLALKMNLTRRAFMHIGYSLYDMKKPNHLMLGLGWRFGKLAR